MRRRSGLPTLIRLAELDARRALHALGAARGVVQQSERFLLDLRSRIGSTYGNCALADGEQRAVEALAVNYRCIGVLENQASGVGERLQGERERENEARQAVAKAKLKLRALENVASRRQERERLEHQRREQKMIDELTRSRDLLGEG